MKNACPSTQSGSNSEKPGLLKETTGAKNNFLLHFYCILSIFETDGIISLKKKCWERSFSKLVCLPTYTVFTFCKKVDGNGFEYAMCIYIFCIHISSQSIPDLLFSFLGWWYCEIFSNVDEVDSSWDIRSQTETSTAH